MKLTDGMLLYHGSFVEISKVELEECKQGKDFGRGFYVTSSYEQARGITDRRRTKNTSNGDKESWRMKRYLPCPFPKYMAF